MPRARVPASSANLGPGFDTLALALALYVEVELEPADELTIETHGQGSELAVGAHHFATRVVREVAGHDRFKIVVRSDIPLGRGLGSSAALAVAAAAAAGAPDPLAVAAEADGHPENAAASVHGGLVTATMVEGVPVASRLPLDEALAFVVVIPDVRLPTKEARGALPEVIPHADAAHNLGRMGLLVAGLADHRHLLAEATDDRLHQPYRTSLFPESAALLAGLVEAGALAACWSGAGPSILGICTTDSVDAVQHGATRLLEQHSVSGTSLRLLPDLHGMVVD